MILPIYAYGQQVLKQKAAPIEAGFPDLDKLIANMWETMYHAGGVGLAAPQVGVSVRLFLVDTIQLKPDKGEAEPSEGRIKQVFLNATMLVQSGDEWAYEEGCLSIPDIRADVFRQEKIRIRYMDEDFNEHEREFHGINARVIQHEYDHIEGVLFIEHLTPLKKRLLKRRLENIRSGKIESRYAMRFVR